VKHHVNLALGLVDHVFVLITGCMVFDGPADSVRPACEQR